MLVSQILEGPHDPHRFKAIFVLGGPGSGKTFIAKKLMAGTGLKSVNVDDVFEYLSKKHAGSGYNEELRKYSGNLTQKRLEMYVSGGLGLIIDGTGRNIKRITETKQFLERNGYDVMAIFVNTDLNVALTRNETRVRQVDPVFLRAAHAELQVKLGQLQQMFDPNMIIIDNSDPDSLNLDYYSKKVSKFLNTPSRHFYKKQVNY